MIRQPDVQHGAFARLHGFAPLGEAEVEVLGSICEPVRRLARDGVIRTAGEPADAMFLLTEGWVTSSVAITDDQRRRQIVRLHLPGDLLGTPSVALTHAAETLTAVTPVAIRRIPLTALGMLFAQHPRLAALIFLATQQERVFLMDRIASLGRTSAAQRLAAFLLHIYDRLRVNTPDLAPEFRLPITQIDIADIIGLTPVHVNRVFRDLEEAGLITRSKRLVQLVQVEGMRVFAGLPPRNWTHDPAWLSQAMASLMKKGPEATPPTPSSI